MTRHLLTVGTVCTLAGCAFARTACWNPCTPDDRSYSSILLGGAVGLTIDDVEPTLTQLTFGHVAATTNGAHDFSDPDYPFVPTHYTDGRVHEISEQVTSAQAVLFPDDGGWLADTRPDPGWDLLSGVTRTSRPQPLIRAFPGSQGEVRQKQVWMTSSVVPVDTMIGYRAYCDRSCSPVYEPFTSAFASLAMLDLIVPEARDVWLGAELRSFNDCVGGDQCRTYTSDTYPPDPLLDPHARTPLYPNLDAHLYDSAAACFIARLDDVRVVRVKRSGFDRYPSIDFYGQVLGQIQPGDWRTLSTRFFIVRDHMCDLNGDFIVDGDDLDDLWAILTARGGVIAWDGSPADIESLRLVHAFNFNPDTGYADLDVAQVIDATDVQLFELFLEEEWQQSFRPPDFVYEPCDVVRIRELIQHPFKDFPPVFYVKALSKPYMFNPKYDFNCDFVIDETDEQLLIQHLLTETPPDYAPGDANGDFWVDNDDQSIHAINFGKTDATQQDGDFDGDGDVDNDDFSVLAIHWNWGNFTNANFCP